MSPVFAHGQLRLYLLALLADGPRHGYDVIRALEERFDGLYSPSAGTVYPRLAKLEEESLVVRTDQGRKAVYALTAAGREEVAARRDDLAHLESDLEVSVRELAEQVRAGVATETRDLRAELGRAARRARADATPAGGPEPDPTGRRVGATGLGDLERAVAELRAEARSAWRRHGLTPEQTSEVAAILSEAAGRIREVVRRS